MSELTELKLWHGAGLASSGTLMRIPPSDSVPISNRVRRILDSSVLRRLACISQLGMVNLVYPGAMHSRFEHTLGVYLNALRFLDRFTRDPQVGPWLDQAHCDAFLLAALLHDAGHWPYCHPIEDMQLADLPSHEQRLTEVITDPELAAAIDQDWQCTPELMLALLGVGPQRDMNTPAVTFLASCLSGPVDIDKLDYLQRDSLHCGVEYGRNFDSQRLISALTVDPSTQRLAVDAKGQTAAEMMVFSRYIMFNEVYWHHTVRAATAMLQRSIFLLQHRLDLPSTLKLADAAWIALLRRTGEGSLAEPMIEGLFGTRRVLYKPAAEFSVLSGQPLHERLTRRPYWWLVALAETLTQTVSRRFGIAVSPVDILIDAPPTKLEVDINVAIRKFDGACQPLEDVSPVAATLARQQFDDIVKKVRLFVRPGLREHLKQQIPTDQDWGQILNEAIEVMEEQWV